nr:hypothetical protein [Pseudomonas silesiensis]
MQGRAFTHFFHQCFECIALLFQCRLTQRPGDIGIQAAEQRCLIGSGTAIGSFQLGRGSEDGEVAALLVYPVGLDQRLRAMRRQPGLAGRSMTQAGDLGLRPIRKQLAGTHGHGVGADGVFIANVVGGQAGRDEGLPGQPGFHVAAGVESLDGDGPAGQIQPLGDRCRVSHADDPRAFGFDPAAVAQDQRQLLGVDGLVVQRQRANGRVEEQLQGFELFCGQRFSGQSQVGGRFEMLTVQLRGPLFSRHCRAGSTLLPEGCPAFAVCLYRVKRLQSFEYLQRGQGRQGVALIQAGHSAVLIQRGLQCRVLQNEGAGLGKADKSLRLLIGGGKQQAGVLPAQIQLLFEPLLERVADARAVGHQLTQALAAFAPACAGL